MLKKKVKIGVIFDVKVLKLGMDPRDDAWLKKSEDIYKQAQRPSYAP